jgi:hypothetical protein
VYPYPATSTSSLVREISEFILYEQAHAFQVLFHNLLFLMVATTDWIHTLMLHSGCKTLIERMSGFRLKFVVFMEGQEVERYRAMP